VSPLFRGPPDTRHGAPGSGQSMYMYVYPCISVYTCIRVYTCVHTCMHVNTSVCRGGSAAHATRPVVPSAPSAVRA